jgi:hypothetical protein
LQIHITVSTLLFCYVLFQKCWMSLGSCLLCLKELYRLIVFHFQFILNLPKLRKGKRIWVFLTRLQNVAEVRKASQFHCHSMPLFTTTNYPCPWRSFAMQWSHEIRKRIRAWNTGGFRTNKSCLFFVDNNTLFHNKQFVKWHLFTGNSGCFSRANLD